MNSCYVFSLISFGMLSVVLLQSFFPFYIIQASPMSFLILTSMVYLFTETLIMFFFVGTGVSIRDYSNEHNLPGSFHKRSVGIKRRIYPPQLLNLLLLMTAFILYGAADTGKVSLWVYRLALGIGLGHFLYAKWIQNQCFRDNTNIVLEMSGLKPFPS